MINSFDSSVTYILNLAQADYILTKALNNTIDENIDEHKKYIPVAKYLKDRGINFSRVDQYNSNSLCIFLNYLSQNSNTVVEFTPTCWFYLFKVSIPEITMYLPLVLTRALMSFIKTLGIKCEVYKRNKSLCDNLDAFFTDLCFTGKSDIDIPVFKPIVDACKHIKGRLNPWFKEEDAATEEKQTELSEASARFRGAEWFESAQRDVTLIGAGGLGSNISVSLCRVIGYHSLTVYDPDIIEHRNLAGQNFGVSEIGLAKAIVVSDQAFNYNPLLNTHPLIKRFSPNDNIDDIVITGLDNMATRSLVFSKWQGNLQEDDNNKKALLLDARLSAEKWQIFCITGDNKTAQKEYEDKWLFKDDEADGDICSYKQTAFAAQMCASFVTNLYINFCTNLLKDDNDPLRRYLPFMIEYDATQMILRCKDI